jgi:hypothetical protein
VFRRTIALTALLLSATIALAQVKVAGVEFLPKNVIFLSSDERSRATAEGSLSAGCNWSLRTETRIGQTNDPKDCIVYYYRTTVALTKKCGQTGREEAVPTAMTSSERTMLAGRSCPGSVFTPATDARILSVGTNADGRRQEIVVQPDNTRVVILTERAAVTVTVVYPDGTVDTMVQK